MGFLQKKKKNVSFKFPGPSEHFSSFFIAYALYVDSPMLLDAYKQL